jgi:hypothetical protein
LECEHGRRPSTKKYYPEPHHPSVTLLCKWVFGRIRETKIKHGVELVLLGFARQPIDPTKLMINRWCCGNIEFGRYWFGVLPLHVGYLFKTGYYKEPEASTTRTSLRFEERKIYK